MTRASDIAIGSSFEVKEVLDEGHALRLLDLGIKSGTQMTLLRRAPFNGAVFVNTEQGDFALRMAELSQIVVA